MATKLTPADSGCYVDGHWGQYGTARVVMIAAGYGYPETVDVALAERHLATMGPSDAPGLSDTEFDTLVYAGDAAESWLNENVAPDGHTFGWHDGEFYLWSTESWED